MNKRLIGMRVFYLIMIVAIIAVYMYGARNSQTTDPYSYKEMTEDLEAENISAVTITQNSEVPTGTVTVTLKTGKNGAFYATDVNDVYNLVKDVSGISLTVEVSEIPLTSLTRL